jgi:hypothetical protein
MKKIKIYFFNNKFFLNFLILLAIFKTIYIALISQYFELISTPLAIKVRLFIILLGIILFFFEKNKSFHKIFFYILFLFITSFFIIFFQLQFEFNIDITKEKFYYFGLACSIITFVIVVDVCYKKLVDLNSYIFYLLLFFSISTLLIGSDEINNRFQLRFLDPISTGYYAGILIILSTWKFIYLNNKLVSLIGIIIGSWLLFETNSKSPILGVLLATFFLLFNMRNGKLVVVFFLFLISFLLFFLLDNVNISNYRFFDYKEPGISIRLEIYEGYIRAISNNFILPSMDPIMNLLYAHNIFLAIYSGTGIIGLMVLIYLVIFTLINSFKLVYHKTRYGWIGLIFILTFMRSLVSGAILDETFWYFLVLTNVYFLKYKKKGI